jgi:type III pantothenate kinase
MKRFLLADIGNTSIKLAFGDEKGLGPAYSLPTRVQHTADSLGLSLMQILSAEGMAPDDLRGCVLCSVVPDVCSLFEKACQRYLRLPALRFPADLPPCLENGYSQPQEVGADRLLAACAARLLFPDPVSIITIDYGTATTFDCVARDTYLGGLICPGLFSSRNALAANTAKLPRISLDIHDSEAIIGRNTETSMSHGFLFGFAALTEGLCNRLARQLPAPVFVVGTGGDAQSLSKICGAFDAVRPDLLLEGLLLLSLRSSSGV